MMNRKLQSFFIPGKKHSEVHKILKIKFQKKNTKLKISPLKDAFVLRLVVLKNIAAALKMAKPAHKNAVVTTVGI
jgi:hypothetical protein